MKRTIIYVDGFNLYYRAARRYNIKWLNIKDLGEKILREDNEVVGIKYFTSIIKRRSDDHKKHFRQQMYLRALSTIPNLDIIKGTFLQKESYKPLADNPNEKVRILLTEEKGSDVNIAVNMVNDAHLDRYDLAVVISNDSDLVGAIEIVRSVNKQVGVLCPSEEISYSLKKAATFHRIISKDDLRDSEFPKFLRDDKGQFHRPKEWN